MNTTEKWFVRSWALLSISALVVHRLATRGPETSCHRGLEMLDDTLTAVVIPLALILAIHKNVTTWRRSPRLWWRRCRRFTFWLGISMAIIPTIVIGYVKGDWSEIPAVLGFAATSLSIAAVAHIRLRHMNCKP